MQDPVARYTALAMVVLAFVAAAVGVLAVAGVHPAILLVAALVSSVVIGIVLLVLILRSKPVTAPPRPPPEGGASYDERVTSVLGVEWPGTYQALRVTVADGVLSVAWDGEISRRFARLTPAFGGMGAGLGFSCPLSDVADARRRRLFLPHFLLEVVRPYQGMGMLGEWKFRVRGVRAGVSIQTRGGLKAWISTRRPDELLKALRAGHR